MPATTPLRMLVGPDPSESLSLEDGPADHVLDILEQSHDRSSWSDELATHVDGWDDRFHLSPQRANVLRGLPLGEPEAVLEIGAAAGALTRYLGEISSLVDALETDATLAAAARTRCADLSHVVVHARVLADVPRSPAYDLVVVADLAASSGTAADDLADLLATCRPLLRPGGRIVVAVDNADGVRQIAGGRPPARSDGRPPLLATRDDVERGAAAAGLGAQVLGAFPDHRHTVTLIDHPALRDIDVALLERIVHLPSPPYDVGDTTDAATEIRSWSDAVATGTDPARANSLVLVAGEHPTALDPLTYWSSGRRSDLSACNRVRNTPDGPVVVRAPAHPSAPHSGGPLSLRPHTEPYVIGTLLIDLLAAATDADGAIPLLRTWVDLVDESDDGRQVPWDLVPRNVQIDGTGTGHAIDQEWAHEQADRRYITRRGAFWLAYDLLLAASAPPAWLSGHTLLSAADVLLALSGEDVPADWRDFLHAEAVSMASLAPLSARESLEAKIRKEHRNLSDLSEQSPSSDGTGATHTVIEGLSAANRELRVRVEQLELARRHDDIMARDHAIGLRAKLETALRDLARTQQQLARQRRRAKQLEDEVGSVRTSTSFRVGRRIVSPVARLARRTGR